MAVNKWTRGTQVAYIDDTDNRVVGYVGPTVEQGDVSFAEGWVMVGPYYSRQETVFPASENAENLYNAAVVGGMLPFVASQLYGWYP